MHTPARIFRFLEGLKAGDLLQEEWLADDGWLDGIRKMGRSDIYRVESIFLGEDGWLGDEVRPAHLCAVNTRTGETENLLSRTGDAFYSVRFKTDMNDCPYVLLTAPK